MLGGFDGITTGMSAGLNIKMNQVRIFRCRSRVLCKSLSSLPPLSFFSLHVSSLSSCLLAVSVGGQKHYLRLHPRLQRHHHQRCHLHLRLHSGYPASGSPPIQRSELCPGPASHQKHGTGSIRYGHTEQTLDGISVGVLAHGCGPFQRHSSGHQQTIFHRNLQYLRVQWQTCVVVVQCWFVCRDH